MLTYEQANDRPKASSILDDKADGEFIEQEYESLMGRSCVRILFRWREKLYCIPAAVMREDHRGETLRVLRVKATNCLNKLKQENP